MRYMMLIASDEAGWERMTDDQRRGAYDRIGTWWNERVAAGEIVGGDELQPSATATTVRLGMDGRVAVTDGPFVEGKEMVGGYAILDVPDLDAAIRVASGWPAPGSLELRPLVEGMSGQGE